MDRGAPVAPGQGFLKGGSEAEERRLVARAADELHAQRQSDLLQQSGNDMAGWPVALKSAVKVSIGARWSNRSFTVPRGASRSWASSGKGGTVQVGVSRTSVSRKNAPSWRVTVL